MSGNSRRAGLIGCVAFAVALATAGFAWANGEEFFQPADEGAVDLVYFGFIKDTNGNQIDKNMQAVILIKSKTIEMEFPFQPDKPSHYRSPDIGAFHKNMGVAVDPSEIQIEINLDGYKMVSPAKMSVPNKTEGVINVDFVMQKL